MSVEPVPGPPIDARPFRTGEAIIITTDRGREVEALVQVASPNGRSLILAFDAMVDGWVMQMPAFQADDGQWASLSGMPLQLRRVSP